jgi:hypothetical protein
VRAEAVAREAGEEEAEGVGWVEAMVVGMTATAAAGVAAAAGAAGTVEEERVEGEEAAWVEATVGGEEAAWVEATVEGEEAAWVEATVEGEEAAWVEATVEEARAGEERVEEEGAAWGAAAMISPRTPAPCPAIGQLHTMSKRVRVRLHIRLRKACMPNLSESRLTGAPPYRPEPYRRASFEKGRTYARLRSSHQVVPRR